MTSTVNPDLPNELILQVIDHTVPSFLEINIVVADDDRATVAVKNLLNQTNLEALPQIIATNSSEWRSTVALLNLNHDFRLIARESTIEFSSTLNIRFKNVRQRSSAVKTVPDTILKKFKRFTVDIPMVVDYNTRNDLIGSVILAYTFNGQEWVCEFHDALWIFPDEGERSEWCFADLKNKCDHGDHFPDWSQAVFRRVRSGLPRDLLTSKLSSKWLSRFRKHVTEKAPSSVHGLHDLRFGMPRGFQLPSRGTGVRRTPVPYTM
ncbi:unnamed protein product [Zymoseptoria tritici ST99CH_3D1]|nr:unnamed protein product [Zymoseptoria tritici ST99CH_3D1]